MNDNFKKLVEKTEKNNIDNFLSSDKSINYDKALSDEVILKNIEIIINKYYRCNDYKYLKSDIIENLQFFIISSSDYIGLNGFNLEKIIIEHIDNNHYYDLNFVYNCDYDINIYNDFLIDIYTKVYNDLLLNNVNINNSKDYIIDKKNKIDFYSGMILFKMSHIVVKNIFSSYYIFLKCENNFNNELFFLKFISRGKEK